jgi:methyltransferase, FkbM family
MNLQKFYRFLLKCSLYGLNYGEGVDFRHSGELNVLKYIRKKLDNQQKIVIFDVGANVGNYSKCLSDLFYTNETAIYSFEPSGKTFEKFIENTSDVTNIIPNNIGFSDIEETRMLFTDNEASGLASVYQRNLEYFDITMNLSETIKLTTIDKYCESHQIDKIHFLKLDIEGHELNALKGAARMINEGRINFIQFEFGGCNINSKTYFQDFYYLLKDKYRIYRILKNGIYEISKYEEILEIFITVNYFAEKKV